MVTNDYIDQGIAAGETAKLIDSMYDSTIALAKAQYYAANASNTSKKSLIASAYDSGIAAKVEAEYIERMTRILGHAPGVIDETTDALDNLTTSTGSSAQATDTLTKAEEKLETQLKNRVTNLTDTSKALDTEIGKLQEARRAVDEYIASTSKSINTVNLESIFGGSVGEDGKLIAGDFIKNFNTAVDQAPWFGNVLNALKQRGVDQTLIEELASLGPGIGGGIGQAALDDPGGLLETLKSKWPMVQDTFKTLASGLVPEGLLAGMATAEATIDGLSTTLQQNTARLNKLGHNIGKAVGVTFKAQLLSDIAEAIREVEAIATAGRAEKVASAARREIAITNTQIAQALQNLLRTNDARNGAPIAPVLS
jgi:ABC-type transporter Mla subunit MlaD